MATGEFKMNNVLVNGNEVTVNGYTRIKVATWQGTGYSFKSGLYGGIEYVKYAQNKDEKTAYADRELSAQLEAIYRQSK